MNNNTKHARKRNKRAYYPKTGKGNPTSTKRGSMKPWLNGKFNGRES